MRVATFNGAGKPITIEDVPDDPVGPGYARIEVGRCGICGSDVSMTSGSPFDYPTGCRLGHETAGTVIEIGSGVTSVKVGDRVAVLPSGYCGECRSCKEGRLLCCQNPEMVFGGFGERMVVPERSLFRIPDSVSMAEGALVEPIACGRRAFRLAGLNKGETVLVLGAGSMGLASIYWARQLGAGKIVVVTRTEARHHIALAMGADHAVSVSDGDQDVVQRLLPDLADIVIEGTGKPGALQEATSRVRIGGTVISLGMCIVADPFIPAVGGFHDMKMCFPVGYSAEDYAETIRAFDAGTIRPEVMVTETVELSRFPGLIEEMRGKHSHLKVQIVPGTA